MVVDEVPVVFACLAFDVFGKDFLDVEFGAMGAEVSCGAVGVVGGDAIEVGVDGCFFVADGGDGALECFLDFVALEIDAMGGVGVVEDEPCVGGEVSEVVVVGVVGSFLGVEVAAGALEEFFGF